MLITRFKSWLKDASRKAGLNNYTKITINDIYSPYTIKARRKVIVEKSFEAKVYIPYSLGNSFILDVIYFQEYIHQHFADTIDKKKTAQNLIEMEKTLRDLVDIIDKG